VSEHDSHGVSLDTNTPSTLDALIVGAGPTGLTMAAQLRRFGVRFRIVERLVDRTRESRALAVQARSLEILDQLGLADALIARGHQTVRAKIHVDRHGPVELALGVIEASDTRFPFALFVSQAHTEGVLVDHLQTAGVAIERGVELVSAEVDRPDDTVTCVLRDLGGREETVRARYLLGCDGARSAVRRIAGIAFEGDTYPQEFLLGDVEIDGLDQDSAHVFVRGWGLALCLPMGDPRSWRVTAVASNRASARDESNGARADSDEAVFAMLQAVARRASGNTITLRDPGWLTPFRLHHRQATHYRAGPLFIVGDAAHIHSPVGGQGMNTGIQDAWNLGWKIALVARGIAASALLDTYEAERWPIGRFLLRVTDRAFRWTTRINTGGAMAAWVRRLFIRHVVTRVVRSARVRQGVFRFISELDVRYRKSPAVEEGEPRLDRDDRERDKNSPTSSPLPGDRLPNGIALCDGREQYLLQAVAAPSFHVLLCGAVDPRDARAWADLATRSSGLLMTHHVSRRATSDADADALFDRLAPRGMAQYLVRPDGHIAYRSGDHDVRGASAHLARWLPGLHRADSPGLR
jgi:2-polyprenyl-6-methoxyphenol hydroxylase-like FAD-dependent oxidoreductase